MGKHSGERPRAKVKGAWPPSSAGLQAGRALAKRRWPASGSLVLGASLHPQGRAVQLWPPYSLSSLRPGRPGAPLTGLTSSSSSRCRQREAESRQRSRANGTFSRRRQGHGARALHPTSPVQPSQPAGRARVPGGGTHMHVAGGPSAFGRGGRPVHMHMSMGPTPHRRPHTHEACSRVSGPARPPHAGHSPLGLVKPKGGRGEPCHTDPTWL